MEREMDVETQTAERRQVEIEDSKPSALPAVRDPEVIRDDEHVMRPKVVREQRPTTHQNVVSFERTMMRHSEQIGQIAAALAKSQGEFKTVGRTEEADITGTNKHGREVRYTYTYETLADVLDVVRKPLADNGIAYIQFPFTSQNVFTVRTMLIHSSGEWIYNDLQAHLMSMEPRDVGGAASYLRRYALKSLLGVASADEDDDAAGQAEVDRRRPEPPKPAAQRSQERQQREQRQEPIPQESAGETPAVESRMTGHIHAVIDKGDGAIVQLKTGYQAATFDQELIRSLKTFQQLDAVVELVATPPSGPKKYPKLQEVILKQPTQQKS